jgi:hypothetical protein
MNIHIIKTSVCFKNFINLFLNLKIMIERNRDITLNFNWV